MLIVAAALQIESGGRRYVLTRDMWHWGLIAAAITTALAVRLLAGRSEAMIDMDGLREAVAMVKAGRSPRSAESSATRSMSQTRIRLFVDRLSDLRFAPRFRRAGFG